MWVVEFVGGGVCGWWYWWVVELVGGGCKRGDVIKYMIGDIITRRYPGEKGSWKKLFDAFVRVKEHLKTAQARGGAVHENVKPMMRIRQVYTTTEKSTNYAKVVLAFSNQTPDTSASHFNALLYQGHTANLRKT